MSITDLDISRDVWYNEQITKIKNLFEIQPYKHNFSEIFVLIKNLIKENFSYEQIAKDIFESDDEIYINIISIIAKIVNKG